MALVSKCISPTLFHSQFPILNSQFVLHTPARMLHLGSIGKTSIDVDFSFFILIAFFVILGYDPSRGIEYALIWIPILFVSVLIHEMAHAAAIALLGFGASRIVLGGMGGHTANEQMRRARPWQDVVISVAGPVSNFILFFICQYLYFNT